MVLSYDLNSSAHLTASWIHRSPIGCRTWGLPSSTPSQGDVPVVLGSPEQRHLAHLPRDAFPFRASWHRREDQVSTANLPEGKAKGALPLREASAPPLPLLQASPNRASRSPDRRRFVRCPQFLKQHSQRDRVLPANRRVPLPGQVLVQPIGHGRRCDLERC